MAKKKSRLGKKNRNTISGLLVGLASLYAISTYMEIPQEELNTFLVSTLLFFFVILLLASLCITGIKLFAYARQKLNKQKNNQTKDKE